MIANYVLEGNKIKDQFYAGHVRRRGEERRMVPVLTTEAEL